MSFYAGVDGGGTKTAVTCISESGELLSTALFSPFNINSVGSDGLRRVMDEILEYLNSRGTCLRLVIGAAGCSNPAVQEIVHSAVAAACPALAFELVGDYEIARYGALGGRPGLCLVAGTGSVCSGVNAAGEAVRVGGWGHLIGDGGSGYAMGRAAMQELTFALDGMAEKGVLCRLLETRYALTSREAIIERVYSRDKSAVAAVAGCVLEAAESGDGAARRILEDCARELSALVGAAARALALMQPEVALIGGLLEQENLYRRMVVAELERALPGLCCSAPKFPPHIGAALMAREEASRG